MTLEGFMVRICICRYKCVYIYICIHMHLGCGQDLRSPNPKKHHLRITRKRGIWPNFDCKHLHRIQSAAPHPGQLNLVWDGVVGLGWCRIPFMEEARNSYQNLDKVRARLI